MNQPSNDKDSSASNGTSALRYGLSLLADGDYRGAHAHAIKLIHQDPHNPTPYLLLARLSLDHNNHTKAVELYQKSVELGPDNAYCLAYYAQALTQLGKQNEAKSWADKAATLKPDDAHLADIIGVVYSRTGFHEKAVPWFKKAVAADSEPANYHYNLGASMQFLGDFSAAKNAYLATLDREPNTYRALASLVALYKQTAEENHLPALTLGIEALRDDSDAVLHLGHALAKTYEDLGDYETSLDWLHRAKAAKRLIASELNYVEIFDAAKQTANTDYVALRQSASNDTPIFVVGLPRTGTTLVDRILSSHRDVVAAGELNTFAGLIKRVAQTPSNLTLDAPTLLAAQQQPLSEVGKHYMKATQELQRNAKRFTDKMPLNFFYAGLILQALPNARIVALRRGAMDSCLSNYRQLLTVQHAYYNYTYDLETTALFYRQFDDLMAHWRARLPQDRFMEIHYEDIVYDQEGQTRHLLDFCGLDWDDACLRFHENDAPVSTASSVQVRQPLYSGSIGRWQRYGDKLDGLKVALGELAE